MSDIYFLYFATKTLTLLMFSLEYACGSSRNRHDRYRRPQLEKMSKAIGMKYPESVSMDMLCRVLTQHYLRTNANDTLLSDFYRNATILPFSSEKFRELEVRLNSGDINLDHVAMLLLPTPRGFMCLRHTLVIATPLRLASLWLHRRTRVLNVLDKLSASPDPDIIMRVWLYRAIFGESDEIPAAPRCKKVGFDLHPYAVRLREDVKRLVVQLTPTHVKRKDDKEVVIIPSVIQAETVAKIDMSRPYERGRDRLLDSEVMSRYYALYGSTLDPRGLFDGVDSDYLDYIREQIYHKELELASNPPAKLPVDLDVVLPADALQALESKEINVAPLVDAEVMSKYYDLFSPSLVDPRNQLDGSLAEKLRQVQEMIEIKELELSSKEEDARIQALPDILGSDLQLDAVLPAVTISPEDSFDFSDLDFADLDAEFGGDGLTGQVGGVRRTRCYWARDQDSLNLRWLAERNVFDQKSLEYDVAVDYRELVEGMRMTLEMLHEAKSIVKSCQLLLPGTYDPTELWPIEKRDRKVEEELKVKLILKNFDTSTMLVTE
jgi:hypothetical protein